MKTTPSVSNRSKSAGGSRLAGDEVDALVVGARPLLYGQLGVSGSTAQVDCIWLRNPEPVSRTVYPPRLREYPV